MVINAIPSYPQAPVALELLENDLINFLESVALKKYKTNYIFISKSQKDILKKLMENQTYLDEIKLNVIPIDSMYSFIFNEPSAAFNVVNGGKPLPKPNINNYPVYSVEDIFNNKQKNVYLTFENQLPLKVSLNKSTSLLEILSKCTLKNNLKAVYLGYPMGVMLDEKNLDKQIDITTDYICVYTDDDCILHQLKFHIKEFLDQCCGQCVFGYEGIGQIYSILSDISNKKGKLTDLDLIVELCNVMQTQSMCELGVIAANLTLETLAMFREEIEQHITKKKCKAVFCSKYIMYRIDKGKCKGCAQCENLCTNDAIEGKAKSARMIDQDECLQCGKCFVSCKNNAISKASATNSR